MNADKKAAPRQVKFLVDLGMLVGGQVGARALGFFAFAYLARTLDPSGYGVLEFLAGLAVIFSMLIDLGQSTIGVRHLTTDETRARALSAEILTIRLVVALLAMPVMVLLARVWGVVGTPFALVILFAGSAGFAALKQEWLLQAKGMMLEAGLSQTLRMAIFVLVIILIVKGPEDLVFVGVAEIVGFVGITAYYFWVQHTRVTPIAFSGRTKSMDGLVKEGTPLAGAQLVWALNQYLPLFFVAGALAVTDLAWFGAAHRLVLAALMFAFIYHFNLYPSIARRQAQDHGSVDIMVMASFRSTAWAATAGAVFVSLAAPLIMPLAFGASFAASAPALAIMIWTAPFLFMSGHARCLLLVRDKQFSVMLGQIAGAISILATTGPAIGFAGMRGGAIAMPLAAVVVWAAFHILAKRAGATPPAILQGLKPLAAGAACVFVAPLITTMPLVSALAGTFLFLVVMVVIEPTLRTDIKLLAAARQDGV